jgi:hypothetical protein
MVIIGQYEMFPSIFPKIESPLLSDPLAVEKVPFSGVLIVSMI